MTIMKKIGFLSFGHWSPTSQSQTRSAADVLLQSVDLAVAAEQLGADGAYFRVHHFARQLSSPFPLLAAVGARTKRIEIGTAVIDMRYENPYYMVEDAGSADLIAGGRLQLGISRGSPEQVIEGWRHFGYAPGKGETDADMGRRNGEVFFDLLKGKGFAEPNPSPMFPNPPGLLRLEPLSEGLRDRIWWGSASNATRDLGCAKRNEPAEFHFEGGRVGRAISRPAGASNPRLQAGVDGRRSQERTACVGFPDPYFRSSMTAIEHISVETGAAIRWESSTTCAPFFGRSYAAGTRQAG